MAGLGLILRTFKTPEPMVLNPGHIVPAWVPSGYGSLALPLYFPNTTNLPPTPPLRDYFVFVNNFHQG